MTRERIETPPNHSFTYEYAQPDSYRFCLDSIIAPNLIARELKQIEITSNFRALDLCSGCGVMGLELAHHEPRLEQLDFLEIQQAFAPYFTRNLVITGRDPSRFRLRTESFSALRNETEKESYDLVICNPPYFQADEGKLPLDEIRRRCRFFIEGSIEELVDGIANALKPKGRAYVLMRSGGDYGRDAISDTRGRLNSKFGGAFAVEPAADIRGTVLVRIDASCG